LLGVSASFPITSLLSICAGFDRKWFFDQAQESQLSTWGIGAIYHLDLATVQPFGELRVGGVHEVRRGAAVPSAHFATTFGLGFDATVQERFVLGAVIRYHATTAGPLLSPGIFNLALRLGIALPLL
jgi:hypothetical protein